MLILYIIYILNALFKYFVAFLNFLLVAMFIIFSTCYHFDLFIICCFFELSLLSLSCSQTNNVSLWWNHFIKVMTKWSSHLKDSSVVVKFSKEFQNYWFCWKITKTIQENKMFAKKYHIQQRGLFQSLCLVGPDIVFHY